MTIKTIKDIEQPLSPDMLKVIEISINSKGDSDHPGADFETTPGFAINYAIECIQHCLDQKWVQASHVEICKATIVELQKSI